MKSSAGILLAGLFVAGLSACGSPSPPTAPSSNAPYVTSPSARSTTYTGHYRMTGCPGCESWEDDYWRFTLTLTQAGDAYSAQLLLAPWNLDANLTGTRQADGIVVMSGTAGPANSEVLGAEFRDVLLSEDAGRGLSGTFTYTMIKKSGSGPVITAAISSAVGGPVPAPSPTVAGEWSGTKRDDGPPCTWYEIPCADPVYSLRIVQQGERYTGFWDAEGNGIAALLLDGVERAGVVEFEGFAPGPPGLAPVGNVEVRRLAVQVDSSGALQGEYDYSVQRGTSWRRTSTGRFLTGARRVVAVSPGPFHGEWRGEYVARTCEGDCDGFRVGLRGLPLTLTQSGALVEGTYATEFIISGTSIGDTVTLEGGDETLGCAARHGGVCSERLRIVVTSIDSWGVMTGTVEHTWNGKFERWTRSGELWRMVRQVR